MSPRGRKARIIAEGWTLAETYTWQSQRSLVRTIHILRFNELVNLVRAFS